MSVVVGNRKFSICTLAVLSGELQDTYGAYTLQNNVCSWMLDQNANSIFAMTQISEITNISSYLMSLITRLLFTLHLLEDIVSTMSSELSIEHRFAIATIARRYRVVCYARRSILYPVAVESRHHSSQCAHMENYMENRVFHGAPYKAVACGTMRIS